MIKFLFRFFVLILTVFILLTIYLSYYGLETNKFDNLIKNKANEVNKSIKLDFNKTKIHLNVKEFNLVVRLQEPKILIINNKIDLSKLDLFLPLKSFFSSDFILQRVEVAFVKNDIKDLTKFSSAFLPKFINNRLDRIFVKGELEGEFIIPFKLDGSIDKNYGFSGKISNAKINFLEEFSLENLSTEIKHIKDEDVNKFKIKITKGSFYNLQLEKSTINIERKKNKNIIKSSLKTKGKLNYEQIKKILFFSGFNFDDVKDLNAQLDLTTDINFNLNEIFRVKNLSFSVKGNIPHLEILTSEKKIIKKYLPEYEPKIILKNTNISLKNSNSNYDTDFNGFVKIKDQLDSFKIRKIYNKDKKSFNISGNINLKNSKVEVLRLNYKKKKGKNSNLDFNINFILNKYYNIKNFNFTENKTKINLTDLKLNKNFKLNNFNNAKIITFLNTVKNNDFLIKKSKKIVITGDVFDAQPLLKTLYQTNKKKIFSKSFSSKIKVNFTKVLAGKDDDVNDFAMVASINNGTYDKLNFKGNFSNSEKIEMSIYQIDKDKKTVHVLSDRARPFMKNFDFIKDFEDGKLEYESTIFKNETKSNLKITDFKVSKVPALAKLLTLASLQGIADTLNGKGIRFDSFEMKSNTKGNVMNIEDALAIGPAISILLNGYVDKGKIVSLRGTLVPATKLNAIIASIPLVGDILVGKKTGEGVVGVSFKMKGPPKDIKTTVNPIKTLTPRFIVRALEKMKSKKKKEAK